MLEKGEPLSQHFRECGDCRSAQQAYQAIKSELRNMQDQSKAPEGWQNRVWQLIAQREQQPQRDWRRALLPVAASVAGAVFIISLLLPAQHEVSLMVSIEPGTAVTRGVNARPGDSLIIAATAGEASVADILIYRNDRELVFRCSAEPDCHRTGQRLTGKLILTGIGSYQPVLIMSESALPELSNNLDEDSRLVLESGATIKLAEQISVY